MSDSSQRIRLLKYDIEFLTPAFLGNAQQWGQWRTPPLKALLRQWWRIVWFAKHGSYRFDGAQVKQMREEEGNIFGAVENANSQRSQVRVRLDAWKPGGLTNRNWHVPKPKGPFDPVLYIGYGLLKRADQLLRGSAIDVGQCRTLTLAVCESHLDDIRSALVLIHHYGTVGGRNRNGWGSIAIKGEHEDSMHLPESLPSIIRPWKESLNLEWPHAIGHDQTAPLIWQLDAVNTWQDLMDKFGHIRKDLRKIIKAPKGNQRVPNNIRFKARRDPEDPKKLQGIIFHMPCSKDQKFDIQKMEAIHSCLDNHTKRIDR